MPYLLKSERGGEIVYIVRVPGTELRQFRPSIFGGEDAAYHAALAYRARMLKGHTPTPKERGPRKDNELGVAGVRRKTLRGKEHFIAFWNDKPGHTVYRSFSVEKYGEQKALAKAIEARSKKE